MGNTESGRGRLNRISLPFTGSLPKRPQQLELSPAKALIPELNPCLLRGWQESNCMSHHRCLPGEMQVPQAASAPLHQTPVSEETVRLGWVMLTQSSTSCVGLHTQRKEGTEFIPLLNSDATNSFSFSLDLRRNK